jgi:hypothetical protein
MKHIPPLRTDRINAEMRELSVGEGIALASVPEQTQEAGRTLLLKSVIVSSTGQVADPQDWTVEERIYAVAHYLSAVGSEANFRLNSGGVLTDYLYFDDRSTPDDVDLAEFGAPGLRLTQMSGAQSELVQTVAHTALDWTLADMAVRLLRQGETRPCHKSAPAEFTQWLSATKQALLSMPSSDFDALFVAYTHGKRQLEHIWRIAFDDLGQVCLPKDKEAGLPPARFPFSACIGELTRSLAGFVD